MKINPSLLAVLAGFLVALSPIAAFGGDTGQVTLTGLLVCGKCKLHVTENCESVLQVSEGGKRVDYFLINNKVSTDFHPKICMTNGMNVSVTGTAKEENGVEFLTASKIEPLK